MSSGNEQDHSFSTESEKDSTKPWGGRFQKRLHAEMEAFAASLPFDRRLAEEDITGSLAHCRMLVRTGIISTEDGALIEQGLETIQRELGEGTFPFDLTQEDIHMNMEKRLIELIGPAGGKLHTARSRNDQVALDVHLFVKKEIIAVEHLLRSFQAELLRLSEHVQEVIIPGYTHLQRAQPVLLSHHLMAYFWMLQRDRERFGDLYKRADLMPLGSGALSGTSFPIDREFVAQELGFDHLYENSMDAVSDRDFVIEFISHAALLMMHLSRLIEELIIWSSQEFSFIELGDDFATGSSMMPQKKNPDFLELVRGKTGRVYGNLVALLTVFKGLPLAYNKDMQEDKEPLFDTVDTVKTIVKIFPAMLSSLEIKRDNIEQALDQDFSTATELADYLAGQGVPFREAHGIVGAVVRYCLDQGKTLRQLTAEELSSFHPRLQEQQAVDRLKPRAAVEARTCRGGTSTAALANQLQQAKLCLEKSVFPTAGKKSD